MWKPIETAPRDRKILLCCMTPSESSRKEVGYMAVDQYNRAFSGGWGNFNPHSFPPTHWMPLPEPPK